MILQKIILLILLIFCSVSIGICQQKEYWQQQVDYKIDVTLNDSSNTLDGYEQMTYFNNSPDTLYYIWFHIWTNAYKNDKTAFSEQLLKNGRTDFYFSSDEKRGYINRLNFRVNNTLAKTEDHPEYLDIIKIVLPSPLAPNTSCKIETPFHVKLPYNFSRGGYVGQSYQITQWYPKPAVYDRKGWHPIPYLDQGEFFSEFGNYEVKISLPENYIVAATGELQNENEKKWLKNIQPIKPVITLNQKKDLFAPKQKKEIYFPPSSTRFKTIVFKQNNVHDFAWFADKRFIVKHESLQLNSGRKIVAFAYFLPQDSSIWENSVAIIKQSILTRSQWLGEYPYNTVSIVEAQMGFDGGMEYPTITSISPTKNKIELESTIEHEVGHNWNYGILATNERDHPWMDEGVNSFYDSRYAASETINKSTIKKSTFFEKRMPENKDSFLLQNDISKKNDQPIETVSEKFNEFNYGIIAYYKTSQWMKMLETYLGKSLFDSCMHEYYSEWKFKHPYPEDFKQVIEKVSGKNLDPIFNLLNKTGYLTQPAKKQGYSLISFFDFNDKKNTHQIFISPAVGYNNYDKVMVGALIHNYTLPSEKFQFLLSPLYGTNSKQIDGIGKINYHWYPDNFFKKIEIGVNESKFSQNISLDTTGKKIFQNFIRTVPFIKLFLNQKNYDTKFIKWFELKSFIIYEKDFDNYGYIAGSDSTITYPKSFNYQSRIINQLSYNVSNMRVLYPYSYQLKIQQGQGFYRFDATGNYFFNYVKKGGLSVRLFASRFFLTDNSNSNYSYEPKLTGGNGLDDYTNSNYFLGRSALSSYSNSLPIKNGGLAAQQIMIDNGGGLKLRLDPYNYLQGQSENWVLAVNLSSTIPEKIIPAFLPLKVFFDIGTYSEAWKPNATTGKFLYTGGLQLSILKGVIKIYAPIIYSPEFKAALITDPTSNKFVNKITFSLDFTNINIKQLLPSFFE